MKCVPQKKRQQQNTITTYPYKWRVYKLQNWPDKAYENFCNLRLSQKFI